MKYNEPLRPKGIGRKQLAFPASSNISELTNAELEFQDQVADSTQGLIDGKMANAIGIARSSAISAASEAHKRSQNYPFGMFGITDFALNGTASLATNTGIAFRTVNIINSNFFYDARDRFVYVNEAGWYLVNVFFYSTAVQGTQDYALSVTTNVSSAAYTESYSYYIDVLNTNKHVSLKATTVINLPNQVEAVNRAGSRYGFRINIHGTMGFASFTYANTTCTLNVVKLADLFEAQRLYSITPSN